MGTAFGQQTGTLKLKTPTGRVGVFLDDKYLGPAANFGMSRSYALAAGDHTVTLREPRYVVATTHVTIVAGKTATVRQDLKALRRRRAGEVRGRVRERRLHGSHGRIRQGLMLPPGHYVVKIVPVSGGAGVEQTVGLKANETTLVRASGTH